MGRPRQYGTPAARQAAYRHRVQDTAVLVDRSWVEHLELQMAQFQTAVAPLARDGAPLACRLFRANVVTLLEVLTDWCRTAGSLSRAPREVGPSSLPRATRLDLVAGPTRPRTELDQRAPSQHDRDHD